MQVPGDRSRLFMVAGIALIVMGLVLNLVAMGRQGEGFFILFPFVFAFGNSSVAVGVLVFIVFLVFLGLFARSSLAVPERFADRTSDDWVDRTCQSCGRKVQIDASYCPYCGTPLDTN